MRNTQDHSGRARKIVLREVNEQRRARGAMCHSARVDNWELPIVKGSDSLG